MQTLWNDLRYAARQLRRAPGFALTVMLTLALGVAANAVVFGVLNALVLRPLPVPDAGRLVSLNRLGNTGSFASSPAQSYPDYRDLREANRAFSGLAAYAIKHVGVGIAGVVHASWCYEASGNYFDILGIQPALGRFFHASDAHGPNGSPYVVLGYNYWQRQFGGDPKVVGRVVEINRHPFTILGVAPKSFRGTELFFSADFWVPMLNQEQIEGYSYLEERGDHEIWTVGKTKAGVSLVQAEADLNGIAGALAAQHRTDEGLRFKLSRPGLLGDLLGKPVQAFLYGVTALAALVLLAACANLGSLFAARASDRARELSVRLALGAGRTTLVRQLITEAVLVSFAGGVLGLALAGAMLHALSVWQPSPDYPVQLTVNADARVWVLSLALAVASGVFFGLVPVGQIWSEQTSLVLKSGTAPVAGSRRWTLRDILLIVQIVLCSVLLTASLVAVRGLARSLHTSFGFQPQGAMLVSFDSQMSGRDDKQSLAFQQRALDAIQALPGVTAAAWSNKIPLSLSTSDTDVWRDGVTDFRDSTAAADASYYNVSPGYFTAAQTRLLAGREFTRQDDEHAPRVAIVNAVFARKVFGTADAVGRYFNRGGPRIQVVGVAEDGKYNTLTEDPTPAMFFPSAQEPNTYAVLIVRSKASDADTAAAIHKTLLTLDASLPVAITSWPQTLGVELLPATAATAALGVLGGLAAVLAVTGIFGMASYSVSKRMREFGLRVALGASRKQMLTAALGKPARFLLFGSAAGVLLGAASSKLLAHVVYQATSLDPLVLGGVILAMALLALSATWLPARRALEADPAVLLREE